MPYPRPARVPLSDAQRRMWLAYQLKPDSREYDMPLALRFRGTLDVRALDDAINRLIDRHETLRTRFPSDGAEPYQLIDSDRVVALPMHDLCGAPEEWQQRVIQASMAGDDRAPIDLAEGPVTDWSLYRLAADHHVLVRRSHHIVTDGWSEGLTRRDLLALYQEIPLVPLSCQYADYVMANDGWLNAGALADGLAFWRYQLAGVDEARPIPTDCARTDVESFEAATYHAELTAEETLLVRRAARAQRVTFFTFTLAAVAAVLGRYLRSGDVTLGTAAANRRLPETRDMIGLFVNTVPLRVRFDPRRSVSSLLRDVRRTATEAYRHQNIPFDRVVAAVAPTRRPNMMPLFQVLVVQQTRQHVSAQLPGLQITAVWSPRTRVRGDLELHVLETSDRLRFAWIYNRRLFAHWRIEQLARHCGRVLCAFGADPERVVHDIALVDDGDRQRLLSI